jgi:hypothetical protein
MALSEAEDEGTSILLLLRALQREASTAGGKRAKEKAPILLEPFTHDYTAIPVDVFPTGSTGRTVGFDRRNASIKGVSMYR